MKYRRFVPILTSAERRALLAAVKYGNHNRAAASLGISKETLKNHLSHAREKYSAQSTAHLAALAYRSLGGLYEIEHRN